MLFKLHNGNSTLKLKKIVIPEGFKKTPPRARKLTGKYGYYRNHKEFKEPIIVNSRGVLIDGYTSYLLAKMFGYEKVDVVVDNSRQM